MLNVYFGVGNHVLLHETVQQFFHDGFLTLEFLCQKYTINVYLVFANGITLHSISI